jgi:hypothetical protein
MLSEIGNEDLFEEKEHRGQSGEILLWATDLKWS